MTRGGLIEAEEGDMFVEGRLDFDGAGHLRFAGNWTEPSDGGCPAFSAARSVWDGLLRGARCGPIHFTVTGKLDRAREPRARSPRIFRFFLSASTTSFMNAAIFAWVKV